jgi:hypothetical protein
LCVASAAHAADAPRRIYYSSSTTSEGFLSYVDVSTGEVTNVYSGPYDGRPITPAITGNTLYWGTYYPGYIRRSDLEGNGLETVIDQGDTTTRAIEFHDGNVYWANEPLGAIYRSPPDFSSSEEVISGHYTYDGGIWDFAIDGDRVYWTSWDSRLVRSTKLDGTDLRSMIVATRAFSLEIAEDRLLVSDVGNREIVSTTLDGDDRTVLVGNVRAPGIEVYDGRLYYNNEDDLDIFSIPVSGGVPRFEASTDRRSFQLTVIPEPSSLVLLGTGALCMVATFVRRRRMSQWARIGNSRIASV